MIMQAKKLAEAIFNRSSGETSLGDTTFIKNLLTNLDNNFSPSSDQLVSLSAGISAYMQKIYAMTPPRIRILQSLVCRNSQIL